MMDSYDMFYGAMGRTFRKAGQLRKKMTGAETLLWERLNNNRLNGIRFRRQHPIANYIVDFYCHKYKLVIEVDGDYHKSKDQMQYDQKRDAILRSLGLSILRFTNNQVCHNIEKVIAKILRSCPQPPEGG